VGAGNLWALAAPGDAALRAHFFLHGSAAGAPAAPDENAAPRNGAPAPLPRLPVARHLADYAARRESARLPRCARGGAGAASAADAGLLAPCRVSAMFLLCRGTWLDAHMPPACSGAHVACLRPLSFLQDLCLDTIPGTV
jgi:hypothetical protein